MVFLNQTRIYIICIISLLNNFQYKSLAESISEINSTIVPTAYLPLKCKEYQLSDFYENQRSDARGGGGAITLLDHKILYGTTSGSFYLIDLKNKMYQANYLPYLDLGYDKLKYSHRITYFDCLPRLHDIKVKDNTIYVSYDKYDATADSIRMEVAKISPPYKNWVTILLTGFLDVYYYTLSTGGVMQFDGDDLILTIGDFELERKNNLPSDFAPQNPNLPWGKVFRISTIENKVTLISLGHRNPQGLTKTKDGKLLIVEHGPRGGDMLELVKKGSNYGWPYFSYGTKYTSYERFGSRNDESKVTIPLFVFLPSIAPSQLIEVHNFVDSWDGDLIIGSLKAMSLFRLRSSEGNWDDERKRILYVEPIYLGQRLRSIIQDNTYLYILTDNHTFIQISPDTSDLKASPNYSSIVGNIPSYMVSCSVCHSLSKNIISQSLNGPPLNGLFKRKIGSSNYNYSNGFKKYQNLYWDNDILAKYIANPTTIIENCTMPAQSVDQKTIESIIQYLKSIN